MMPTTAQIVQSISQSYDELPYMSNPFPQTHPDSLRAVCSLFDIATPMAETANILEIGCSFGGNIIPIAQQYPQANIIGLDISEKQIAIGKTAIEAMGLKNIKLEQQDITNYDVPDKLFDYIICHGVYSWVPEPVKKAILHVISNGLSDKGVAIVSYNTYPGWKIKEIYRDAMSFRSQHVDNVKEKISYGFGMLDFLKDNLPKNSPWAVAIEKHYQHIREASPSYLAHEYFEQVNDPCYFHEFMTLAETVGLDFVAEADFQNHFLPPVAIDDDTQKALKREANGDIIRLEQLHDYLSDRSFRQTILKRNTNQQKSSVGKEEISFNILEKLHIKGGFIKEVNEETQAPQWRTVSNHTTTLFQDTPITAFIFNQLNEQKGQTLSVKALWSKVKDEQQIEKKVFYQHIAELVVRKAVTIRSSPNRWRIANANKPQLPSATRALARWILDNPDTIGLTTAFHSAISLDVVTNELLALLDGKHNRQALISQLIEAVSAKRITFYDTQQNVITDDKAIAQAAKEHTESLLIELQHHGLLR